MNRREFFKSFAAVAVVAKSGLPQNDGYRTALRLGVVKDRREFDQLASVAERLASCLNMSIHESTEKLTMMLVPTGVTIRDMAIPVRLP